MAEKENESKLVSNGYPPECPWWLKMAIWSLQKFGIATVILLIGGWWTATRIADPLVQQYTTNIELQGQVSKQQAETLASLDRVLRERSSLFVQMAIEHRAMLDSMEQAKNEHRMMLDNHIKIMEKLSKGSGG
jgi:BMFP domain-containing protein YqiC